MLDRNDSKESEVSNGKRLHVMEEQPLPMPCNRWKLPADTNATSGM